MRIITGIAKGRALAAPEGLETRPTAERTKEAIFSSLQFDLEGRRVLDLFAGSGQMALEAISRGAASALMVDRSRKAVEIIEKNIAKTGFSEKCRVACGDYAELLKRNTECFDIVFLDPPYAAGIMASALIALHEGRHLSPIALLVCESNVRDILAEDARLPELYECVRVAKYGIAQVTVLRAKEE